MNSRSDDRIVGRDRAIWRDHQPSPGVAGQWQCWVRLSAPYRNRRATLGRERTDRGRHPEPGHVRPLGSYRIEIGAASAAAPVVGHACPDSLVDGRQEALPDTIARARHGCTEGRTHRFQRHLIGVSTVTKRYNAKERYLVVADLSGWGKGHFDLCVQCRINNLQARFGPFGCLFPQPARGWTTRESILDERRAYRSSGSGPLDWQPEPTRCRPLIQCPTPRPNQGAHKKDNRG